MFELLSLGSVVDSVVDWADRHEGFLVALATFSLVAVTALYVLLTSRLVRLQQQNVKRDIVEKVIPALRRLTQSAMSGSPVEDLAGGYKKVVEDHAFLIYHPLFRRSIRREFDWIEAHAAGISQAYQRVVQRANSLAVETCRPDAQSPEPAAVPAVDWYRFDKIVLSCLRPGTTVDSVISAFRMTGDSITHMWLMPNGAQFAPQKKPRAWLLERIEGLLTNVRNEPDIRESVATCEDYLRRVKLIDDDLGRELKRAGYL